MPENK